MNTWLALIAAAGVQTASVPPTVIRGEIIRQEPNGNTVIVERRNGLVVIDTGRHPEHQQRILQDVARRGKPVLAIVNTHWHLDHSAGNRVLRSRFPDARLYTSAAVRRAVPGFLSRNIGELRAKLDDPKASDEYKGAIRLYLDIMAQSEHLLPDVVVDGPRRLAGLRLDLVRNAATAGDTIVLDPANRTLVAGDIVVLPAPYFDTACAEGWRLALDRVGRLSWDRLIPGHGPTLSRPQFDVYRRGFGRLLDCARTDRPVGDCATGWVDDVASIIDERNRGAARSTIEYYLRAFVRSKERQAEFCAIEPEAVS